MSHTKTLASTTPDSDRGTIRLCTAQDIIYKAFKRPYRGSKRMIEGLPVLQLFASCWYPTNPWQILFAAVKGMPGTYQLLEQVPSVWLHIVTYYAAGWSSAQGAPVDLGDSVTIVDAYGSHEVRIEPLA